MENLNLIAHLPGEIHPSWKSFLNHEIITILENIEEQISSSHYTPAREKVLRFLTLPLNEMKVIILGQDPYPQEGVATGRAFEVGTLKSWSEPFRNVSLKNILRLLYKTCNGHVVKFNELKEQIGQDFQILPPGELFKHWEKQGVLLLNTAFTCEVGKPGSHSAYWQPFTERLLKFLAAEQPSASWFIWGNHAEKAVSGLDLKYAYHTQHPMMCYDKPGRTSDFLFGKVNPFAALKNEIDWTGFDNSVRKVSQPRLFSE
ncbi:uracil-DNA glycosylase [Prolixibacter bellariivorans]|uniref:Uracil-DNA glycosylase n=1 Tax=Prolixibacter bellariivorans TaxID=314319 RepID=A0A5M4AV51_9BACT|nr:uracil-DNA glycosylase [Prolixibacter bellariivorans]GET31664.1 uracil-DNA glycosylase [Prolixibacter bellariivorans]